MPRSYLKPKLKLMLVTNKGNQPLKQYLEFIEICAQSGITSVQLREKNMRPEDLLEFGRQLKALLDKYSIPLIVNDNVELALALNAAGVHLGQADGSVTEARHKLGEGKIIGLTVDTFDQIDAANKLPEGTVDYVGVGAVFISSHKPDVATVWGCSGLREAVKLSKYDVVAIGGIDETNAYDVMQTEAVGIAAIGVFHKHNVIIDKPKDKLKATVINLREIADAGEYKIGMQVC